jgi:transposase-like protein
MASIVAEIYVSGVSTRKVREIAEIMGVSNISKSQVSELCSVLDEEVEQFRLRDFSGDKFSYLWLDATWMKCRVDGRMVSQAVVTAIALNSQGFKKMVGIDCVDTESYESWKEFLSGLKSRGVSGVVLVVSDQHAGLIKAINEVFVGASHQRCITHLQRNVKSHIHKKSDQRAAAVALRTAFTQTNPLLARMCYQEACRRITMLSRTAGSVVEEAENEALAYLTFPKKHWSKIKTNNIQERTNRELKRRYRTVQSFPSRCALLRLIGSVAIREEERWETHRMFSPNSTSRAWTCTEAREYDPAEIASARATAEDLIAKAIDGAMEKE